MYVRTSYVEPHWHDGCKKHSNKQQQFFWTVHNKMTTAQNLNLNHFTICEMNHYSTPHTEPSSIILLTSTSKAVQEAFLGFVISFTITKGAVIHCSSGVLVRDAKPSVVGQAMFQKRTGKRQLHTDNQSLIPGSNDRSKEPRIHATASN